MALAPARSKAVGLLVEAIRLRTAAEKEVDKESARSNIYVACTQCYELGMSRTEVHTIIKAITAEFKIEVA